MFLMSTSLYSQEHHYNWPLGNGVSVNFVSGSPVVSTDCSIDTFYPTAGISDENGNLLLYSNGQKIWNRNHEIMENGEGLLSNSYTSQGVVIIPKPGSSSIFYVITTDNDGNYTVDYSALSGLDYSVVDLNLDSGLGAVIPGQKNINLLPRSSEKLTYIKDFEGNWIFATHYEDKFYFFKIDENGVNPSPKIVQTGIYIPPVYGRYSTGGGTMKFSHDGQQLAISHRHLKGEDLENNANRHGLVRLFDFDINSLSLSNERPALDRGYPMGIEFSPNNEFLYVSSITPHGAGGAIYQYETNTQNVAETEVELHFSYMTHGIMQMAPDGKIYKSPGAYDYNQFIGVINNPDQKGMAADYDHEGVELPHYYKSHWGLPQGYDSASRFNILAENFCESQNVEFSLSNASSIKSVTWNFNDPDSGAENISTSLTPTHQFSTSGTYEVEVVITDNTAAVTTISRNILISKIPDAINFENLYACEDETGSGFSSSFDLLKVQKEILEDQPETHVDFINQEGEVIPEYQLEIYRNSHAGKEKIIVEISNQYNNSCKIVTSLDIIVQDKPELEKIQDIYACEGNSAGYASFDLTDRLQNILNQNPNCSVKFFNSENVEIEIPENKRITNNEAHQETIYLRLIENSGFCYAEQEFNLIVKEKPLAYALDVITACDDDGDGIAENFDISRIAREVLGDQQNKKVTFYKTDGSLITDFATPYANSIPFEETIVVRVTDLESNCYAESSVLLKTSDKPSFKKPSDIFACDRGDGKAVFDLSDLKENITGNREGFKIICYNEAGEIVEDDFYINSIPERETLQVKIIDENNKKCFAETTFDLVVNSIENIDLQESYYLCDLEASLPLEIDQRYSSYEWKFEDGSIISESYKASLVEEGSYLITVTMENNGITCISDFLLELVRSDLPEIVEVKFRDWSSNNSIEIIGSGDGSFEYSIDGNNFQDSNYFNAIPGGFYKVYMRDKKGCGIATQEVVLVDYPKFFTPNSDGHNDLWQIFGVQAFPEATIQIHDRYGKLLKIFDSKSKGWDGTIKGKALPSDDYWFVVYLEEGRIYKGHFSLIRG